MTLVLLILIPLLCGILALLCGLFKSRVNEDAPRVIFLSGAIFITIIPIVLWLGGATAQGSVSIEVPWINAIGAHFALNLDGLSLAFVALTGVLALASAASSWGGIKEKQPFYYFNLGLTFAGINGVFLASDLFLFVFMWELMLIPMFFIIDIWGHESKHRAAIKFFIFTQTGGLLMIAAVVGLYIYHGAQTGEWTFLYSRLLGTHLDFIPQLFLMLGFFLGFAVKLPIFGLHPWLPDAHTQAPTAGSVILAGLLLKTGGYGLLRFAIPLFPEASRSFAPIAMWIGAIGIIYGGLMALGQKDLKRLVAYSSVSHLGFVLLGLYTLTEAGFNGAVIQMLSHGLSTGGLFMLVGALQDRIHTREMMRMGGLKTLVPRMGFVGFLLTLALLGLPGMGNFLGELYVLMGAFSVAPVIAAVSVLGVIFAMAYSLIMYQKSFQGTPREFEKVKDLGIFETGAIAGLLAILIWIGVYPSAVVGLFSTTMESIIKGIF